MKHTELNRAEHVFNPWLDSRSIRDRTPHEGTPNTLFHPQISLFHSFGYPQQAERYLFQISNRQNSSLFERRKKK